jgi:hypothetical protein
MNNLPEPNRLRNQFDDLFLELQAQSMNLFVPELMAALYDSGFDRTQFLYSLVDHLRSTKANEQLIYHLEQAAQSVDLPNQEGEHGTDTETNT